MKKIITAALAATWFLGAPTVSAQTLACPAHAHEVTAPVCTAAGMIECPAGCECDRGYHPQDAGQPVGDSNPCVRDAPAPLGSRSRPLAAFGAVRSGSRFRCPDGLGARRVVSSTESVSNEFAREMLESGNLEETNSLPRGLVYIRSCHDPMAGAGAPGSLVWLRIQMIDQRTRILCGSADDATDEQVLEDCRATRALIESIRNLRSGSVTVHYGDRDYTLQEIWDQVLVVKFGEIVNRLTVLEDQVRELEERADASDRRDDGQDLRIGALEARPDGGVLQDFANATHLRIGAFGRLGFSTAGPATGAGGASLELLFRFGDLPLGVYGRIEFGGQETGWDVGGSLYLSGGAGLTYFSGGRRDTTVSLGLFAEDLLEPFADDPNGIGGSEIGVAIGAELSLSIPLPGDAYWVRIRPGLAIAHSERYYISEQGAFSVVSGAYIAPTLAIEFQPDW